MKRFLYLLAALLLVIPAARGEAAEVPNWLEVFVRSYSDSDGDGLGDLNGLASRLDYIYDMGWRGLWLMPVMPSPSYHKYDVTDYCAVDPQYGTMEDMRALVEACHARDMAIIVDMPVNHTSTRHPWFVAARDALLAGDEGEVHVGYYNFSREGGDGFVPLEGADWYYEERFTGGGMPDLNLDNPAVMDEIEGIFRFWLEDVGVDGFRLDAVTSYYTRQPDKNVECLRRLKEMAEAAKPGSVLIGECWASLDTIAEYYESGADSFFLFPAAQAEGFIVKAVMARRDNGEKFARGWRAVLEAIPEGWLTPFLCNHDTGRTVGLVQGRSSPQRVKLAEGALGMLTGGVFHYYGEEIGMAGSGEDPDKRLAMYWDDGEMTEQPPGTTKVEYPYPSVAAQLEDPASLLNYVKAVNRARLEIPAISFGADAGVTAEGGVCVMRRTHPSGDCLIAINFSTKESATVDAEPWEIAVDLETGDMRAELTTDAPARLTLPPCAIVVLTPTP